MKLLVRAIAIAMAISCGAGLAACDGDAAPGPEPGAPCGGRSGAGCAADQYCDFGNNRCGSDDAPGACMPRPEACPALLVAERTCGCDGRVYSSACEALLSGADLNESGSCALDPGAFACGYRQCDRTTEYCERMTSDVGGEPNGFDCGGLPAGCGSTPSCGCLSGQTCGDNCSGDAARGLTVTCPGG